MIHEALLMITWNRQSTVKKALSMPWTQKVIIMPQRNLVLCSSVSTLRCWGSFFCFSLFSFPRMCTASYKTDSVLRVPMYLCPNSCSRIQTLGLSVVVGGAHQTPILANTHNTFCLSDPDLSIMCFLPLTSFVSTLSFHFPN